MHKDHLLSACVFSFFIGDNELYDHLPLSHSSDAVPVSAPDVTARSILLTRYWQIYIGRDANMGKNFGSLIIYISSSCFQKTKTGNC